MPPKNRPVEPDVVENLRINKHLVMGYVFLVLVFMGAVSSVYYWENKVKTRAPEPRYHLGVVESGEQSNDDPAMCVQMVVQARNKQTGEIRDFPTPCDVNEEWWEIIE